MSKQSKRIILLVAIGQILFIVGILAVPRIVQAIPGRYRIRLPEQLVELVTTPLPTALPAPAVAAEPATITIPNLQPTVAPTETPSPTATAEQVAQVTAAPTDTPTPTATPTHTPTPEPLPERAVIEGMKGIPQGFNNCGPANLTQVLAWYGDPTTQTVAAAYLKPNPEDRNVSPWQLSDYVNDFTALKSTVHSGGNMELLKRFLAAGFPVVIEKGYEPNTAGAEGWYGHYLTVYGYDDTLEEIYTLDTYQQPYIDGNRVDTYEDILYYWQQFNYTFYVVYQPFQEETVHNILGPDLLDPIKMWQAASLKAQADIEAAPEDPFAWLNLGVSLTRLGEATGDAAYYQNGAAAFDQARTIGLPPRTLWYEFRPYMAYWKSGRFDDVMTLTDSVLANEGGRNVEETYYYRGLALLSQGKVTEAVAAFEQALALNTNFYPAQLVLDSLR
ncbi:MAG: C39 family peptidase [Chloroflexota bacterium]